MIKLSLVSGNTSTDLARRQRITIRECASWQTPSVTQWNRSYDQLGWRPIDGAHVQLPPSGPIISNDFCLPLPHLITNSRHDRTQYIPTGTRILPEEPNDRMMGTFLFDISCHGSSRPLTKVTSFQWLTDSPTEADGSHLFAVDRSIRLTFDFKK